MQNLIRFYFLFSEEVLNMSGWNMLFYLWGLFRGRRGNGVDHTTFTDVESSKTNTEGKSEHNDIRELSFSRLQVHDLEAKAKAPSCKDPFKFYKEEDCSSAERCLFPVGSQDSHESTSNERSSFTRSHDPYL